MKFVIALISVALALGACANARDTRMAEGAVIGGTTGAVIGGVATHTPGGAVIGGITGTAVGAVIADATRPRHAPRTCHWDNALNRRVCHYR
ncbi:MAG: hypothetical protein P4L82_10350 [Ancalomicrobiaceae bacterium]|nr:hypothetical protein [Ancalomicrobiaceae bacterium]